MENQTATEQASKLAMAPSPHIRDGITTRKIMLTVCIGLVPSLIAATYYFGPRALLLTVICVLACMLFEQLFCMVTKKESTIHDCSAAVTGMILAFNLPSSFPAWMAIVGCFIAIILVKNVFGGIGCNFANPAATARVFLLVSFATQMTTWPKPLTWNSPELIVGATPLKIMSPEGAGEALPSLVDMFLGNRGGSLGETCALALIVGGVFLIWKGIISPVIPVCVIGSVAVFALLFGQNPLYAILSGGVMIGAFFMATDYATSPFTMKGQIIFGIGIGFLTMVIRQFCSYPEGMSFAILLMNILTPHIDNLTITKPFGAVYEQPPKQ